MCSGVVPQQPPTTDAPAASIRATIRPKYSGPAAYTNWPSIRWGRPAFGTIDRAGAPATPGPNASSASRQACGPTPQLTPITSTGASSRACAAAAGDVPSASSSSSPNVSWATIGRSLEA